MMQEPERELMGEDGACLDLAMRMLPVSDDPETAGFWEAAARHELVVRRCLNCRRIIHLPRSYCSACGTWRTGWEPIAGDAVVHSWTVVENQVHPAYPVPYTLVLIELVEEPSVRFLTSLPGAADIAAGQSMKLTFEPIADGSGALPRWLPL
jgi:uncharacterized OB-fold protein